MELRGVIIQDKAGCLLKMLGLELHACTGREAKSLLSPRDECLLKLAPQSFSAK